jgi:hypothetical protein
MKITDVSVTMFNWKSEAWRTGTVDIGGHRLLGVVAVHTDEGVAGHAFLGSSRQGLVYAPEKPGLGYEIDWELVTRETVQVAR